MRLRLILILSVALNATLVVAIFVPSKRVPVVRRETAPVLAQADLPSPARTDPSAPARPFRWSEMVSDDLKMYRDNLRSAGCPELTVREIITAVINEQFGARRHEILATAEDTYWDMVKRGDLMKRQTLPQTGWAKALTALAAEREQTLADVLGAESSGAEQKRQAQREEHERERQWLPANKRAQFASLEDSRDRHVAEWAAALGSRPATAEEQTRLEQYQQEFEDGKKALLTPDELEELKLRESDVADWAANLQGFAPSEQEWRSLTALRLRLEQAQNDLAAKSMSDDEKQVQQTQLQANFNAAAQQALSPDRFAQYQLANNEQYQAVRNVTQRYGLPDSLAFQAAEAQQSAQNAATQIRANSNLSPEDQQSALNLNQQHALQTLSQILGAKTFSTYEKYSGDWLNSLSELPIE
jgi:hypothetical protein